MAVRAIRGAIQLDGYGREEILEGTAELVSAVMSRNELTPDAVISVLFTVTHDLTAEFPALAARKIGFHDVPLMCAQEIRVPGAMPRVVRLMAHVETDRPRSQVQHVYLRGAIALRLDIAQLSSGGRPRTPCLPDGMQVMSGRLKLEVRTTDGASQSARHRDRPDRYLGGPGAARARR